MGNRIEISLSKNKLFLGIGGSILFVILGIWLFTNSTEFQNNSIRLMRNPMVIKSVGIVGMLFFKWGDRRKIQNHNDAVR